MKLENLPKVKFALEKCIPSLNCNFVSKSFYC